MASSSGQRPLAAQSNRRLESLTWALEHSRLLSITGKVVSRPVAKLVGTGWLKNLLSGTGLGHPAHPMLTDVPIGAWTSALLLDLLGLFGGSDAASRRGADTLVAVGVAAALPTTASGLSDLSDEVEDSILAVGAAHALWYPGTSSFPATLL